MIHREGKVTIFIALICVLGFTLLAEYLTVNTNFHFITYLIFGVMLVFFLFILNFFRNPKVDITLDINKILAPCDGKVVVIEEVEEKIYFKRKMRQISIFMSPLNVHVNRNPIAGKVMFAKYFPGKFLVAWHPKSSELNEQTYFVVKNEKIEVGFKQIAGAVARRICYYIKENQGVQQGDEMGFIKFGSRMDIFVPLEVQINVKIDDITKGGQTILATI